ncbi:MAG: hypothetical protein KKB81_02515 [Candidatus Margulisbacteria bacterium]|nr:hypothetical protein [Candidatus Margulisiibacteriota bacterium]MBU1021063.1 hypothetical protein [Candidatus Margulisiibacteriota bacterium]MBU1729738.1 hypothetical protein [Candidatus Margulisiibacteriota bacterium]MBU1956003.1 hypothetical protein [Candidatus Margulisiibacteriota bacterium]
MASGRVSARKYRPEIRVNPRSLAQQAKVKLLVPDERVRDGILEKHPELRPHGSAGLVLTRSEMIDTLSADWHGPLLFSMLESSRVIADSFTRTFQSVLDVGIAYREIFKNEGFREARSKYARLVEKNERDGSVDIEDTSFILAYHEEGRLPGRQLTEDEKIMLQYYHALRAVVDRAASENVRWVYLNNGTTKSASRLCSLSDEIRTDFASAILETNATVARMRNRVRLYWSLGAISLGIGIANVLAGALTDYKFGMAMTMMVTFSTAAGYIGTQARKTATTISMYEESPFDPLSREDIGDRALREVGRFAARLERDIAEVEQEAQYAEEETIQP